MAHHQLQQQQQQQQQQRQRQHQGHAVQPKLADLDGKTPLVFQVGRLGEQYWTWVNRPGTGHPRFFDSSFLESCSKTPWWVVPLLWLPIFTACFWRTYSKWDVPGSALLAWLLVGIVAWQLLEYVVHRFVFHARSTSYLGITLHFLFHGCHHKFPMDKLRLVFPPVPASGLVALVYFTLHASMPEQMALPLFAGMGYGYVAYDCLHYAMHHHGMALPALLLQDLRKRHMHHHYKNAEMGFGISSVLYDVLFQTSADCQ